MGSSPNVEPGATCVCVQDTGKPNQGDLSHQPGPQVLRTLTDTASQRPQGLSEAPQPDLENCHRDMHATTWSCHFGGDLQE